MSVANFPVYLALFHGTSEKFANIILKEKNFKMGHVRDDHWLGQGIYFFREDYSQAQTWAKYKIKNTTSLIGHNAAVINTNIFVLNNNFLNLDTKSGLDYFKNFLESYDEYAKEMKIEINVRDDDPKKETKLMCLYCNVLPDEIKLIQRTFRVESNFFDKSNELREVGLHLHGVQICIRDKNIINYQDTKIFSISQVHSFSRKKKKAKKYLQ